LRGVFSGLASTAGEQPGGGDVRAAVEAEQTVDEDGAA
jgi:hypothetical protein